MNQVPRMPFASFGMPPGMRAPFIQGPAQPVNQAERLKKVILRCNFLAIEISDRRSSTW